MSCGTPGPATPTLSERDTDLADRMPADTLVYAEARDVGATVHDAADGHHQSMAGEAIPGDQLDQVEAILGAPVEDYLDFVEDAGIGVSYADGKAQLGIAATVNDPARAPGAPQPADQRHSSSGQPPVPFPLTVTTADISGVTVTTITPQDGSVPADLPVDASISVALR